MNSNCQTITLTRHDSDDHDASQLASQPGRSRAPALLGSNITLAALAILATLGLMLAFYQVVLGAVANGESLQQTRNQQSAAFWRCNGFRNPMERDNCLATIKNKVGAESGL